MPTLKDRGWGRPEAEMLPDFRQPTPSRPPLLPVRGVGRGREKRAGVMRVLGGGNSEPAKLAPTRLGGEGLFLEAGRCHSLRMEIQQTCLDLAELARDAGPDP